MCETTKYNYMENVLQSINTSYISLPDDDVKLNNRILEEVIDKIISQMKEDNLLFKSLYRNIFYGGSSYDGLRVGKPEEFDLVLLLVIPKYAKPVITISDIAGFAHLQLQELEKFKNQPEASRYPDAILSQNRDIVQPSRMCYTDQPRIYEEASRDTCPGRQFKGAPNSYNCSHENPNAGGKGRQYRVLAPVRNNPRSGADTRIKPKSRDAILSQNTDIVQPSRMCYTDQPRIYEEASRDSCPGRQFKGAPNSYNCSHENPNAGGKGRQYRVLAPVRNNPRSGADTRIKPKSRDAVLSQNTDIVQPSRMCYTDQPRIYEEASRDTCPGRQFKGAPNSYNCSHENPNAGGKGRQYRVLAPVRNNPRSGADTRIKPKSRRSPQKNKYKVRTRSQKLQDMWNYIRYSENLNYLTKAERITFSNLTNLLTNKFYLNATKVSAWIEGIFTKALNKFGKSAAGESVIITSHGHLTAKMHKGGPAHTLKLRGMIKLKGKTKNIVIDVDLVPGFVFTKEHWPGKPFRKNVVVQKDGKELSNFFIVPKKPSKNGNVDKYWRLTLQEQERELISGYQNLKPTIKLFKKLRDSLDHKAIASYYIKTFFLWELKNNTTLWSSPLSYVFMTMLEKYQKQLESKKILYYWNSQDNLIKFLSDITLQNMSNSLKGMIAHIKRDSADEYAVAKYLLTPDEFTDFQTSGNLKKLKIIN